MDSVHAISSANNACSFTTDGNLWRCERSTKNICYTSCCDSKAFPYKRKSQIEYNPLMFKQSRLNNHYKWIRNEECNKKYVGKAISRPYSEPEDSNTKNILVSIKEFMVAFYLFCYPYTVIGRTLSTVSASLFVVERLSDISPLFFIGLLQALVPHLFMDIYVNGVNQLFDLEIDKFLASFVADKQTLSSIGIWANILYNWCHYCCIKFDSEFWACLDYRFLAIDLECCVVLSSLDGLFDQCEFSSIADKLIFVLKMLRHKHMYRLWKVPLLRWKGHPLLAAMVIFATWAVIFPITFFAHMQTFVLKRAIIFPRSMSFAVVFLGFYSLGIALFKDIPDIDGDQTFGIQSFSARLGQKRVFWICVSLFEMAFGVAVVAGLTSSSPLVKIVTSLGHAVLGSILWYQAKSVDLSSKASIGSFYMLIWK
ncbi:hypothetical protein V8G54_031388, partial [Vigna mungo]